MANIYKEGLAIQTTLATIAIKLIQLEYNNNCSAVTKSIIIYM